VTSSWCIREGVREGARHGRPPAAEKGSGERGRGGCSTGGWLHRYLGATFHCGRNDATIH